jgi:hypothetical protein
MSTRRQTMHGSKISRKPYMTYLLKGWAATLVVTYSLRSPAHVRELPQHCRCRRSNAMQLLRQGDAEALKLYSQAKLSMMREALAKLDRDAN